MYNVISKLNKGDSFVCYRESKLTRILQPYLGGNSITAIICTVSPAKSNFQETANTLRFGLCAGSIKNDVKINIKENLAPPCIEEMTNLLRKTKDEEQLLETEVEMQKKSIEENETEYELKTQQLEIIYETYLEALQIKKELVTLKSDKQEALSKGKKNLEE